MRPKQLYVNKKLILLFMAPRPAVRGKDTTPLRPCFARNSIYGEMIWMHTCGGTWMDDPG